MVLASPTRAFFDGFDAIYVINLPSRADRRSEMEEQLAKADLSFLNGRVRLFDAVRPDEAGAFPSIGARGCFLSHLGVLQTAERQGCERFLILEDDANVSKALQRTGDAVAAQLGEDEWSMFYGGYEAAEWCADEASAACPVPADVGLRQTHAIAFTRAAVPSVIGYLEAMLARPAGHPEGGPMHVDGAYSWFRRAHPDLVTLASREQLFTQRFSRTDIAEPGLIDRLPLVDLGRRLRNQLLN